MANKGAKVPFVIIIMKELLIKKTKFSIRKPLYNAKNPSFLSKFDKHANAPEY